MKPDWVSIPGPPDLVGCHTDYATLPGAMCTCLTLKPRNCKFNYILQFTAIKMPGAEWVIQGIT